MKKTGYIGMMLVILLLSGCGKETHAEDLQQQYREMTGAQLSAEVVCHLASENRAFTVECCYDKEQGATTSITEPEDVKGISATVSGDNLTVTYDGMILSAGDLTNICPANCLPYLLHAVSDGYLMEYGVETLEGRECLRAAFDTTAENGEKILCTVWFDGESYSPEYVEFSQNDNVVLTARILSYDGK